MPRKRIPTVRRSTLLRRVHQALAEARKHELRLTPREEAKVVKFAEETKYVLVGSFKLCTERVGCVCCPLAGAGIAGEDGEPVDMRSFGRLNRAITNFYLEFDPLFPSRVSGDTFYRVEDR